MSEEKNGICAWIALSPEQREVGLLGFRMSLQIFDSPIARAAADALEALGQKITITRREQATSAGDYHACLQGKPEIWGCGESAPEAVGSLVLAHLSDFGISGIEEKVSK